MGQFSIGVDTDDLAAHLGWLANTYSTRAGANYSAVARLVPLADKLTGLDMRSPAQLFEPAFTAFIVIAAVGPEVPTAVFLIQHSHEIQGTGLVGVTDLHFEDQFVPTIHADRQLAAEVGFAAPLRSARLDVLLPVFGRCSVP